jgi:putative oxidoreductase
MAKAKRKVAPRSKPSPYPGLYLPGFGPFYDSVADYIYPFLRVVAGLMLLPHGFPKLMAGPAAVAAGTLERRGIEPAFALAVLIMALETVGAICIIIGLYTRPIALLLVAEFLVIVFMGHWSGGWFVGTGGIEFAVLWGCVFIVILLRGGGPHSVDKAIGKEF